MNYDLEPQKRPRAPDAEVLAAEAALAVTEFSVLTGGAAPSVQGPSDEDVFTKIIPNLPGWCSEAKARRLARLVVDRHARVAVEIGVFGARSLLALGVGGRVARAQVIGIDPYTADASLAGKNAPENDAYWQDRARGGQIDYEDIFRKACAAAAMFPNVRILRAKSLDAASVFDPGTVDLIHIDGNHSEETSCADVRAWLPKMSLGGIVIMDDVGWETTRAAQKLLTDSGCKELERVVHKTNSGNIEESWAVYQCVGSHLK